MNTIENLRARKLQLEQRLKQSPSVEQREWIEGELTKIDIALGFLDDVGKQLASQDLPAMKRSKDAF